MGRETAKRKLAPTRSPIRKQKPNLVFERQCFDKDGPNGGGYVKYHDSICAAKPRGPCQHDPGQHGNNCRKVILNAVSNKRSDTRFRQRHQRIPEGLSESS